jgi:acyl-CoA synthetase (NDP forming)
MRGVASVPSACFCTATKICVPAVTSALSPGAPEKSLLWIKIAAVKMPPGKEMLLGMIRDPQFGPLVVVGFGGIYVEVLRDVTFRLAPIRPLSARHMIESVKAFPLLRGVRGEAPSDIDALAEAIERVSQLSIQLPEVAEMDLNPMIVRGVGSGVVAVDVRVVLAPPSTPEPSS